MHHVNLHHRRGVRRQLVDVFYRCSRMNLSLTSGPDFTRSSTYVSRMLHRTLALGHYLLFVLGKTSTGRLVGSVWETPESFTDARRSPRRRINIALLTGMAVIQSDAVCVKSRGTSRDQTRDSGTDCMDLDPPFHPNREVARCSREQAEGFRGRRRPPRDVSEPRFDPSLFLFHCSARMRPPANRWELA